MTFKGLNKFAYENYSVNIISANILLTKSSQVSIKKLKGNEVKTVHTDCHTVEWLANLGVLNKSQWKCYWNMAEMVLEVVFRYSKIEGKKEMRTKTLKMQKRPKLVQNGLLFAGHLVGFSLRFILYTPQLLSHSVRILLKLWDVLFFWKKKTLPLCTMDHIQHLSVSLFFTGFKKVCTDRGRTDCVKLLAKLCLNCHGNRS